MKFCFGDIVVVYGDRIGVVVKSWYKLATNKYAYEVYVRTENCIITFDEDQIQRYMVRHKVLSEEELFYQKNIGVIP